MGPPKLPDTVSASYGAREARILARRVPTPARAGNEIKENNEVAAESNGRAVIIAALIVSLAVVGGSFFIASSLERTTAQLVETTEALENLDLAAAPIRG